MTGFLKVSLFPSIINHDVMMLALKTTLYTYIQESMFLYVAKYIHKIQTYVCMFVGIFFLNQLTIFTFC